MDMDDTLSDSISSVSSVESILDTMLSGDITDNSNLQLGGFPSVIDENYTLYICIAFGILIFFSYIVYTKLIAKNTDEPQCGSCNNSAACPVKGLF
jgi:hypothetical protein